MIEDLLEVSKLSAVQVSKGPSDEDVARAALPGGPTVSNADELPLAPGTEPFTLDTLPVGAHLILRCRKDWRDATIIAVSIEAVTLSVGAPRGRTYRVRRPPATPLSFEGAIPIIGAGSWRAGFARYDTRW
ncbi:MAG TPA: hypothetical protein VGC64_04765 [Pyrinomonadaceae bacterium]